jgi:hypothetical protein
MKGIHHVNYPFNLEQRQRAAEQSVEPKPGKANLRAVTQMNPIRPRGASRRTASLPKMVKPATGGEATEAIHYRAFRGGWGQRAGKDSPRNLETGSAEAATRPTPRGNTYGGRGTGRESERPIVCAEQRIVQEG